MVTAELRRLHSPDVRDLQAYQPADPAVFGILVQAMIGPRNQPGEESFDFVVCTPQWLAQQLAERGSCFGRHYLFLLHYDYDLLWEKIARLCARTIAPDWNAVGQQLGQYGRWEFEGYIEAPAPETGHGAGAGVGHGIRRGAS